MARPGKCGLCLIIAILAIMIVACASERAWACVGARQMAMGGTFVGIADDMSAVYWNPAGIAMLDQRGFHVTSTLSNRDTYNYDDFLVCIWPEHGDLTVGLSLIREHLGEFAESGRYQACIHLRIVLTVLFESCSDKIREQHGYPLLPTSRKSFPSTHPNIDGTSKQSQFL
jgi:hypothetical protein